MKSDESEIIIQQYPFLSIIRRPEGIMVGVIQKITSTHLWMYDYSMIMEDRRKKRFLELVEKWYYQSDLKTPIDIFCGLDFSCFQAQLRGFSLKEVEDIIGPQINLNEQFRKRIKRKNLSLSSSKGLTD